MDAFFPEGDPTPGSDFLARLCVEWERAALALEPAARVVTPRLGIVLGVAPARSPN